MSQTITSYSMEEIKQVVRDMNRATEKFLLEELDKIRERLISIETMVSIYNGKVKFKK